MNKNNNRIKCKRFAVVILMAITATELTFANSDVEKLTENPTNWLTWDGNYAATRQTKTPMRYFGNTPPSKIRMSPYLSYTAMQSTVA